MKYFVKNILYLQWPSNFPEPCDPCHYSVGSVAWIQILHGFLTPADRPAPNYWIPHTLVWPLVLPVLSDLYPLVFFILKANYHWSQCYKFYLISRLIAWAVRKLYAKAILDPSKWSIPLWTAPSLVIPPYGQLPFWSFSPMDRALSGHFYLLTRGDTGFKEQCNCCSMLQGSELLCSLHLWTISLYWFKVSPPSTAQHLYFVWVQDQFLVTVIFFI